MVSKALSVNRPHKPMVKLTGKRDTGNPYVAFDVAGAGNVCKASAPALDPTCEGR